MREVIDHVCSSGNKCGQIGCVIEIIKAPRSLWTICMYCFSYQNFLIFILIWKETICFAFSSVESSKHVCLQSWSHFHFPFQWHSKSITDAKHIHEKISPTCIYHKIRVKWNLAKKLLSLLTLPENFSLSFWLNIKEKALHFFQSKLNHQLFFSRKKFSFRPSEKVIIKQQCC